MLVERPEVVLLTDLCYFRDVLVLVRDVLVRDLECVFILFGPSEAQPAGLWPLGLLKYIFYLILHLSLQAGPNSFGLLIFGK